MAFISQTDIKVSAGDYENICLRTSSTLLCSDKNNANINQIATDLSKRNRKFVT